MRKLHFTERTESGGRGDCIVPPGERGRFGGFVDSPCTLSRVHLVVSAAGVRPVEVIVQSAEGDKSIALRDGVPAEKCVLIPSVKFAVTVENAGETASHVRPVVQTEALGEYTHLGESLAPLEPMAEAYGARRVKIAPHSDFTWPLVFEWPCAPRVITMRSDSKGDVEVSFQLANVYVTTSRVPVELFADGFTLKMPQMNATHRMTAMIHNKGSVARWVEIDLDVEPVTEEKDGTRNA